MRLLLLLAGLAVSGPTIASDDLARQIDVIAPAVNAGDFAALGGPTHPGEIIAGVDGRWFTLANTVRNWGEDAAANERSLANSIRSTCSDTWENLVTYTVTGEDTFRVDQASPEGEDHGSFDMQPVEPGSRTFTTLIDDDYIVEMFGLENAPPQDIAALREEIVDGLDIWRPTPDVMVNIRASGEPEVWGRCPVP